MNIRAAIAFILAAVTLAICGIGYGEYVQYVGFPDGFATDYELVMRMTFIAMALPLLCLSLVLLYLAISGRARNRATTLNKCTLAIVLLVALFFGFDLLFYHYLDHGQGG